MLTLNDGRCELWQWDTGRTLSVDADCSQVHFSNKVFGRSKDVDVIDGIAAIPDILLQTDKDLNVWAFVGTAENGYTKISKTFKVNRRNKPADYVFTPPDQTTLDELVERLGKIEESQDPDAIKNAVEDYLEQNPVEVPVQSVNGQTGEVKLTAKDVGAISQDDLQEATNEALAQAKESGEFDGADGKDGGWYTPAVTQPDKNTIEFAFIPSKDGMSAVAPVSVELPDSGGNVDLTGYATEQWVQNGYQPKGNYLTEQSLEAYAKKADIPTTLPASDVAEWAKQPNKPSYTASEVGALPDSTEIPAVPTKVSAFQNDSGYATETFVAEEIAKAQFAWDSGETEVAVPVDRDWEGWTVHASTNINSSGKFVTGDTYSGNTTYSYVAEKDCDIYVERLPVGNDNISTYICIGIYPAGDSSDTTDFVRYRYVINSEDSLPKAEAPLSITAGTLVAVCVYTSNFNVYGLVTEMQNKSPADLIDDRIDAKLGIAVQLINNGANQTVTVYHASNGDYCIGQTFERVPNTEKNSDVWHLKHAYICDTNSFSKVNSNPTADNYFDGQIVNNGEWENAIKETGMDDFMGGTLHGDEKFTSVIFFLDGKPLDMSADFFLYGRELKVVETTALYRVADGTTKVVDRSCIWTFKDGEIKVTQTHKFAVDSTLLSSYTMMFPVNKKYSENFLVDGNPFILNFPKETANNYEPEDTVNITEQLATVWSNGVVCEVSVKSSVNGTWSMQDNEDAYNKLYFDIGNRSYSAGDVIKTKTVYRMRVGEYTA